jgi:hypothetical protein
MIVDGKTRKRGGGGWQTRIPLSVENERKIRGGGRRGPGEGGSGERVQQGTASCAVEC